ncbi:hypothetical protein [Hymenobacter sp.]|uniref:hypothetical protein n=1 Tax=Hymenobacter sp. TaxID=1898978 RepID=UPI00286B9487|nr:hypothetical protein [Hymenobacter sp.]
MLLLRSQLHELKMHQMVKDITLFSNEPVTCFVFPISLLTLVEKADNKAKRAEAIGNLSNRAEK